MTKVTVLHNVDRDASFGLNLVFDLSFSTEPGGSTKHYRAKAHSLVRVFEFDTNDLLDTPFEDTPASVFADQVFRAFNVGHEPGYAESTREYDLAVAYRARRLRSLSVGDVLVIETGGSNTIIGCERLGWFAYDLSDLLILDADEADRVVRERYQFRPGETLAITVPLTEQEG